MHKQKVMILLAAGVGMLCTFLPWVTIPIFGSINGTQGDGWITLALFGIAALVAIFSNKGRALSKSGQIGVVVPALLASAIGVWKIIDFKQKMGDVGKEDAISKLMSDSVSIGFGLYLMVLAGLVMLVVAFRFKES